MRDTKFPHIHVHVTDGAPRAMILERVADAFRQFGVPEKSRKDFTINLPCGYANTIDYIRDFVDTD